MDRILSWHFPEGHTQSQAFYMECNYEPEVCRVYAATAPNCGDMEFDILDDGVSIFNNHASNTTQLGIGTFASTDTNTKQALPEKSNSDEMLEDFSGSIEEGSWVTCVLYGNGGAKNISIQLELSEGAQADREDDEEEE